MRTEITYYAFDDTEFDNEQECLAYEKDKQELFRAVEFYGDDLKLMSTGDPGVWNEAMYFRVVDPSRTEELFRYLYYYTGIDAPTAKAYCKGDVFYYDPDFDKWFNLTEELKRITDLVKHFEEGSHADT